MIGDLSEYELANLEYDRLFRSRKSQREIAGQATAVGSGPGVRILLPPAASQSELCIGRHQMIEDRLLVHQQPVVTAVQLVDLGQPGILTSKWRNWDASANR